MCRLPSNDYSPGIYATLEKALQPTVAALVARLDLELL